MRKRCVALLFILLLFISGNIVAQIFPSNDSVSLFEKSVQPNKQRRHLLNYSVAGAYGLSMAWLYSQWYTGYPQSAFHLFNDNGEWEQVDKFAHCWNTYTFSKALTRCYQWSGYDERKAMWIGTGI